MFKWAKEQKIYDAGFAKGLMFGKAVATRDERDRIIALLEADCCKDWTFDCCDNYCRAYKDAIKIIKGGKDD